MKVRVIIIDDERIARDEVKRALSSYPDFEIIAEAKNATEAKLQIESLKPDVIFLDIQMPGQSGFGLLESLSELPEVIFTTAFNQYAVDAFDINALDYLVKPVRKERLDKTIARVREKLAHPNRQLFIKDGNRCHFVKLHEIYLVESIDNYAKIYYGDKVTCIKRSLNQLEETLDPEIFFRISRSQIINTNYISQIHSLPGGRLQVSLQQCGKLEVSVRQAVKFKSLRRI